MVSELRREAWLFCSLPFSACLWSKHFFIAFGRQNSYTKNATNENTGTWTRFLTHTSLFVLLVTFPKGFKLSIVCFTYWIVQNMLFQNNFFSRHSPSSLQDGQQNSILCLENASTAYHYTALNMGVTCGFVHRAPQGSLSVRLSFCLPHNQPTLGRIYTPTVFDYLRQLK